MVKVRRADVLVVNGLDLDNWIDLVVQGQQSRVIPAPRAGSDASRHPRARGAHDARRPFLGDVHPAAIRTTR
jgi:hypothetical protein